MLHVSRRRGKKTVRMRRLPASLSAIITAAGKRSMSRQLDSHLPVTAQFTPRSPVDFRRLVSLCQFPQQIPVTVRMGCSPQAVRQPLHEVTARSLETPDLAHHSPPWQIRTLIRDRSLQRQVEFGRSLMGSSGVGCAHMENA